MFSLAVDDTNSIYLGPDGNLAVVQDQDAAVQASGHAMKAQLREMNLAVTRGVPTLDCIWNAYLPAQFIAAARRMLLSIGGGGIVTAVQSFVLTKENGVAAYVAQIQTIYSDEIVTITGNLAQ